ncbi:hypothetical protein MtrunA17_Chr3g0116961 [Medicago truncatula]|uniref:Uncharacterized protein n=1 Tax=Medicago truncatula TaxID=3880 RepID=A0A396IWA3_MEDTR|nr:hypothetical protein MtrunA17_Chr3g0116961 [Medicago truncatula]
MLHVPRSYKFQTHSLNHSTPALIPYLPNSRCFLRRNHQLSWVGISINFLGWRQPLNYTIRNSVLAYRTYPPFFMEAHTLLRFKYLIH